MRQGEWRARAAGLASALAGAAAAGGCAATGEAPRAGVRAALFPHRIEGNVEITQGGVPGSASRIDVDDDLGLERAVPLELGVELEYGAWRVQANRLPLGWQGSEVLRRDVLFHGRTFAAGDRIESELDLETWWGRVDAALIRDERFELRAGAGVWWWQFDLELRDLDTGVVDARAFSRLLPAATLAAQLELADGWVLRGDGAYAAIDAGRRLVDASVLLDWRVAERLHAAAGWRRLRLWLDEDTNDGLLDLSGPLLTLTLRF